MQTYCHIAKKYVEEIYLKTYLELREESKYQDLFTTLWRIIEQYSKVSADKAYGSTDDRASFKDNEIISNIAFYDNSEVEHIKYDIKEFDIAEDLKTAKCPNGCISEQSKPSRNGNTINNTFSKNDCNKCPLRDKCLPPAVINKEVGRRLKISKRYDAVVRDMNRVKTKEFEVAYNKRYIVGRRFATLVRNHGLRRCRYLRLKGAKTHIILANTACNIVRMVNLLFEKTMPDKIAIA